MPAGQTGGRDSRANRLHNQRLKAISTICWICGEQIDTTLPATHPRSWTADHIDPLMNGGAMLGQKLPAHRDCNGRRGAQDRHHRDRTGKHPTSREW